MGQITADQSHQVMAVLATNVAWSSIDFEGHGIQEAIIANSRDAGKQFELFIKNRARLIVGEPKIIQTKPFNPAEFIGKGWTIWKGPADGDGLTGEEDFDPRSRALTEIDITWLRFETCLREGESSIKGEEKIRRLKEMPDFIRLGGNAFLGFWEDYQANKENSALEWIYRAHKIRFIDFPDDILRSPGGSHYVLCLYRGGGGEWGWGVGWPDVGWDVGGPSAGLASQS